MKLPRREFLKKSGVLTTAGLIPPGFLNFQNLEEHKTPIQLNFIIKNVLVLSMDDSLGDISNASVIVENGKIKEVSAENMESAGFEVIDGTGGILLPGLIDNHWHLWTSLLRSMAGDQKENGYFPMTARYSKLYTPDDMFVAAKYAAAEAINAGVTTLNDFNHNARNADYVMASFNALASMGMRGRVAYGGYRDLSSDTPTDWESIREVYKEVTKNNKYKNISLGLGARSVTSPFLEEDWKKARELGLPITIHASSTPEQKGQIAMLAEKDLLGPDINIIHANAITPEEIEAVTGSGTSITMTPYSEMRIGFGLPKVNELMQAGVNLGIGVDTTSLSGNEDLFSIMKLLLNLGNAFAMDEFHIKPRDLLKMATIDAAKLLGIENITGSVTPGKSADLILLRKDDLNFSSSTQPYHLVVEAAQPENVEFVSVEGKILKKDGKLQGIDRKELISDPKKTLQRMQEEINRN